MRTPTHTTFAAAIAAALACPLHRSSLRSGPTIDQFLSPGYPSELVSARKADRIAWLAWERGKRNVYAAAAPSFTPASLTKFLNDDGIELSELQMSDDGTIALFIRGSDPNKAGWIANPTSFGDGAERAIWAAKTDGSGAWRVGLGTSPALSPDGRYAVVRQGQSDLSRARVAGRNHARRPRRAAVLQGVGPQRQSALVTRRIEDRVRQRSRRSQSSSASSMSRRARVKFMAPSVDRDVSPTWSHDGKEIAFIRRPGLPFGQQAHDGVGGLGDPPGPARGLVAGRGGRGDGGVAQSGSATSRWSQTPGMQRATFDGGYTLSFWTANVETGEGHEVWHNEPNDRVFTNINAIQWQGASLVFQYEPEEWARVYAVSARGGTTKPIELTPGAGQVETVGFSADG